jgi:hypothetical protein
MGLEIEKVDVAPKPSVETTNFEELLTNEEAQSLLRDATGAVQAYTDLGVTFTQEGLSFGPNNPDVDKDLRDNVFDALSALTSLQALVGKQGQPVLSQAIGNELAALYPVKGHHEQTNAGLMNWAITTLNRVLPDVAAAIQCGGQ